MPKSPANYQAVIDLYFWLYEDRYRARPTWKGQDGAQLKRLLKAHGQDEVVNRLLRLFDGQLAWANEPYTWSLFVHQIDALVPVAPKTLGASYLALVADALERNGE